MKYVIGLFVGTALTLLVVFGFGQMAGAPDSPIDSSSQRTKQANSTIDLSNKNLTKVTSAVYGQTDTTELILSNNQLESLPTEMGRMTNLRTLKLDHNLLKGSLIGELRMMSKLEVLDVSHNNMTGVPAEIGQLTNLQTLNYSDNKITGVPNELAKLNGSLKELNMSGNPLNEQTQAKLKAMLPSTTIIF